MEAEEWRPVFYRGSLLYGYEVSTAGRMRLATNGRSVGHIDNGRPIVVLRIAGEYHNAAVANVVAQTFLGAPTGAKLRYRDGDRANVRATNLDVLVVA